MLEVVVEVAAGLGEQGSIVLGGRLGDHIHGNVILQVFYDGLPEGDELFEVEVGVEFGFVGRALAIELYLEEQLFYFALHQSINRCMYHQPEIA